VSFTSIVEQRSACVSAYLCLILEVQMNWKEYLVLCLAKDMKDLDMSVSEESSN
jgi:hypothetical protein